MKALKSVTATASEVRERLGVHPQEHRLRRMDGMRLENGFRPRQSISVFLSAV